MKTQIEYLYGDSTPSPLSSNFIAFLRDLLDFAVDVLVEDDRVRAATQEVAHLEAASETEVGKAIELAAKVGRALDGTGAGGSDSISARCAARIRQGAEELVRSETGAARALIGLEKARIAQVALGARNACWKAFEKLTLRQDLPGVIVAPRLWIEGSSHYVVQLHAHTPYGLRWVLGVKIP